jgi:chromosomal replication initiator protein
MVLRNRTMIDPTQFSAVFHKHAQKSFSPHIYGQWIKSLDVSLHPISNNSSQIDIKLWVSDVHTQQILETRFLKPIKDILSIILDGYKYNLLFLPLQGDLSLDFQSDDSPQLAKDQNKFFFTSQFTFDTFVLGPSNQFAHAASKAISEDPGNCFNPLFIFGFSGLGKTHLIRAIGYAALQKNQGLNVNYSTCENFINDFNYFTRNNALEAFRKKYREDVDVFLLDDIQFLSKKEELQEEFFYTFNALFEQSKQIVITSDKVPKDLIGLESRIRTRFEWGLVADIQPPELNTRIEILKEKMKKLELDLDSKVLHYLASNFTRNIRELEGVLHKLKASKVLIKENLDLASVKKLIKPFMGEERLSFDPDQILKVVAQEFGCRVLELKSSIKARDVTLPRHISMYLIRKYTEKSYPEIGLAIGGKDHATVMHGVRKISRLLFEDQRLKKHIEHIEERLKCLE